MDTPRIRILSTGGTIASTANEDGGKTPAKSGDAILERVPGLDAVATLEVEDVCQVSGFQMTGEHANALADAVESAASEGVDGVVVTHGTDTMAETAYVLESVLEAEIPVVCTGSQRSFDQLGSDGPTNLDLAVRTAAESRFQARGGCAIAFNDTIHAARHAVKAHTSALETFQSPETGPIAERTAEGIRLLSEPAASVPAMPGARLDPTVRVPIVTNAMGVDGQFLEETTPDGIVVAGTGLGNTTAALGERLEEAIADGVPVVLSSRCFGGATAGVYGGGGGGARLLEAGAITGGDIPPWKARLTCWLGLSAGEDPAGIEALFNAA